MLSPYLPHHLCWCCNWWSWVSRELGWISSAEVNATGVPQEPHIKSEPCKDV